MAQFLSQYTVPNINSIDARLVLANEILLNIFQKQIEGAGGRGVYQGFSNDTSGAQIRIIRVKPLTQEARELGATLNGGNFPTVTEEPTTQGYGLDVITSIDQPVDIARASMDMIPVDLAGQTSRNIADLFALNLNAMTIAGKFLKSSGNFIAYNSASTDEKALQLAFLEANDKLNEGDIDNGVSIFPMNDRTSVIKPSWRSKLMAKGVLVVGGANYAYDILAKGVLSAGATASTMENGYVGDFDGTPVHIASTVVWSKAEKFIGLPAGSMDKVIGYFSSALGNIRAVAANEQVKVIDAPAGQGVRLQPLYRMGFNTIYPKANAFIYNAATPVDIIAGLTTLGATKLCLKAPGSRGTLSIAIAAATQTPTTTLPSGATAEISKYFATLTSGVDYAETVEAFITGYAATVAGLKGDFTSGSAVTVGANGTYKMWCLVEDTYGNVAVKKSANFTISGL